MGGTKGSAKILAVMTVVAGLAAQCWAADKVQKSSGGSDGALTPEEIKAGQTIVADTCNACHESKKPLSIRLLKEKSPAKMTRHFQKKAELSGDQISLVVRYLTAVRAGKAELPKTAVTSSKSKSGAKSKRGEEDDEDDDE